MPPPPAPMLERQHEGVQRAKREGKYKGRAPTARAKAHDIVKLAGEGMKREDIAKRLGVGVASVYHRWRRLGRRIRLRQRLDALSQALAANPRFKVLPRSCKGFIIGG